MTQRLPLDFQEQMIYRLRSLYSQYGYTQYKMNKFEEYDLYARNKDFLISDNVITFTDMGGRLMALKPDVTLSIVKNSRDNVPAVQKLCYNENVYRVSGSSHSFREIMQVGLECLGAIDDYCLWEVVTLACESLRAISRSSVLNISHLGLLSALLDDAGIPRPAKEQALELVADKNIHDLAALCRRCGMAGDRISLLRSAVACCGAPDDVLPRLRELLAGVTDTTPLDRLEAITGALDRQIREMIRFDFSAVDDIHYYNGIVFKGYIHGLPDRVLSGGQYDKLMRKMGKTSGAVGFAVYMDTLERLDHRPRAFDADILLLYGEETPLAQVCQTARKLKQEGRSVLVQRQIPETVRVRQILKLSGGEVEILENHA